MVTTLGAVGGGLGEVGEAEVEDVDRLLRTEGFLFGSGKADLKP